jgi:hypothetical protein
VGEPDLRQLATILGVSSTDCQSPAQQWMQLHCD